MSALEPGAPKLLSVPGKTFLIGEYLALTGGPSLLLSTAPRFELEARPARHESKATSDKKQAFAPGSPAGHYLARHRADFADWRFSFIDPHKGKGGLGASSAQFALLCALRSGLEKIDPRRFDWKKLLEDYRACAWNGEGSAPSGADVVSQLCGGITSFDGREFQARRLEWVFPELSFTLLRTGTKLATHEHLRKAQAAPHEALRLAVGKATTAFETRSESLLVSAIEDAARALDGANLTAEHTLGILARLKAQSGLAAAAKGCGAMGADVILVVHDKAREADLAKWAATEELEICGGLSSLSEGLVVKKG